MTPDVGHWPLEPSHAGPVEPGREAMRVAVDMGSPLGPGVLHARRVVAGAGGSWERRQLRRLPMWSLVVAWALAHLTGASTAAACFMWLLFAGAVMIVATVAVERCIHLVQSWDGRHGEGNSA